jgi:4a-hydroxytetrahydrobiopterin dehydratase
MWKEKNDRLVCDFVFDDFKSAFAFMTRVAFEAEAMNHHPDWLNIYNKVTIHLSTHDAGGKVTDKDYELAERIDACYRP